MTIEPSWVVAGIAVLCCVGLIIYLRVTRRKPASVSDSAGELVEAHRADAERLADADEAAGVAGGAAVMDAAETLAGKEVKDAIADGGLANTFNSWPRDS